MSQYSNVDLRLASFTLIQFKWLNAVSNDDSILDLIVMYLLRFQTVTRQSPGVGCWKLSLTITLKRCPMLTVFELPYYREKDSCSHSSTLLQATCPWQTWPRTALPTMERVLRKPLQIWTSPSSWIRCRLCLELHIFLINWRRLGMETTWVQTSQIWLFN